MKSHVISFADYTKLGFRPEEAKISRDELQYDVELEIKKLCLGARRQVSVSTVEKGDVVTLDLESENRRFNRSGLHLNVGLHLFSEELEGALISHHVGDHFGVEVAGVPVTVHILACERVITPPPGDALVEGLGLPGIHTLDAYKKDCGTRYFQMYSDVYLEYQAAELMDLWFEKSEFCIDREELEAWSNAWIKLQQENSAFHGTYFYESYEGEAEEMCRADAFIFFRILLAAAKLENVDTTTWTPACSEAFVATQREKVLAPLQEFLRPGFSLTVTDEPEEGAPI